jgi:HK97 family phage major capsid protein
MGTMTVSEARSEIKNLFDQADVIEKKYPDGIITSQEDEGQLKKLLTDIDSLESKLGALEDAHQRRERIMSGLEKYTRPASYQVPDPEPGERKRQQSPGDQFLNSRNYRELKQNGTFNSQLARVAFAVTLDDGTSLISWGRRAAKEGKALVHSGASDIIQPDRLPGYLELLQREINVMDLVPRVSTVSDTIEYVREHTFTNAAASVAEASATTGTSGKKAESTLIMEVKTSPVTTIAHWIPITNKMLADAPAMRGIINGRLLLGLDLELEDLLLTGDGTGSDLTGILSTAGINIQGKGTDNEVDAIFKARTQIRVNGRSRPNAVVLHPNDWQAIRLMRENVATATMGNYLMGPPSQIGATTLWGLPVVESEAISENTGLVGDFAMGATLFDREQASIRVGTIDDQFVRNMQTILAELRAAFVVWRPAAFTRVTGI